MLQRLEYLVSLATHRHFGQAAKACNVSQPALSSAISRLERELGVVIVHRSRRFEGFTPEGLRVLAWAHSILAEQREMLLDVDRMRGQLSATVRIGTVPTSAAAVPPIVARLRAGHPRISAQILALPSREISRRLTEFELDAGLTYLDDETPPGTRRVELYRERYVLLGPAGHPVMAQQEVTWAEAAQLPLCALTSDMRNRRLVDARMAAAGVRFHPVIEANTVATFYVHLAGTGLAAVVAHPWIRALGVPPGMAVRPLAADAEGSPVGVITLERSRSSLLADAVIEAAAQVDVPQ